jgi:hypothetical protein
MPQELARKRRKIPEEEFKDGLDGLKYYDLVVGAGAEPKKGDRVAIHFGGWLCCWSGVPEAVGSRDQGVACFWPCLLLQWPQLLSRVLQTLSFPVVRACAALIRPDMP